MSLVTKCAQCRRPLQVPDNAAGKPVRCPHCQRVFVVAAGAAPVAEPRIPVADQQTPVADAPGSPARNACPACGAALLAGAIACMDCGYMLRSQPEVRADEVPNLCTNPACGVANAAKDRVCQRCGAPLPTPAGTVLHGRYRIERQLAVGGFGAVYLAADLQQAGQFVAVKDMICADPQEFNIRLNFFRREAEILRALEAVSIVPRVYDFIQNGNTAHLVMEYIRGQDLLKIMEAQNNRPFPLPRVIEWAGCICDVLIHMHGQTPPLIHRDLKPDNIMLLEDSRSIKMIDFGTARDLGHSQRTRRQAKTRVFTEGYAPPEQIIGKPEARSDLFALAGTLYHLATGKAPEGAYTARELGAQLADPRGSLPANDRWFFELLKINLAEDPNERYYSARALKQDLQQQQVTRETPCPKCRSANPVRQPYCGRCGEGLTEPGMPCTQCGKSSRLGSRCCIYCGNRFR